MDTQGLTYAAAEVLSRIPEPLKRNAFSALNRLCTAALDIPIASLEGQANERRAESLARVKVIETSAEQIAQQMQTDPEYARIAVHKFGQKILRERVNLDAIAQLAVDQLSSEDVAPETHSDAPPPPPPISEDWMNVFEEEAAKMSSDQMQRMFSKILAGEIRKPSSFSIKSVRTLAHLDNTAAALFKTLCSLSVSLGRPELNILFDARVVSMGSAGNNSLQPYGLPFDYLNILQEYGLIISDYTAWYPFRLAIPINGAVSVPMNYLNERWALVPKDETTAQSDIRVTGVALTRCGRELLSIVEKQPNDQYTTALKAFFERQGFVMTKVVS